MSAAYRFSQLFRWTTPKSDRSGFSVTPSKQVKSDQSFGATRFELATSWSQTTRSNQTELRPVRGVL